MEVVREAIDNELMEAFSLIEQAKAIALATKCYADNGDGYQDVISNAICALETILDAIDEKVTAFEQKVWEEVSV